MGTGQLIECEAGDLILWDSRTVHGGKICSPSEEFQNTHQNDFVRLSLTVTMLPRSSASEEVLEQRKIAFMNRTGHTHWANETKKSGMGGFLPAIKTDEIKYDWPEYSGDV